MSSLTNSLNMAESYLAYFADDIAFDTANDHHTYKGLSTDRKHDYLKNEIVKIESQIRVLYHIQENGTPNPFNHTWLDILQAKTASLAYSVTKIESHLNGHATDVRQQQQIERLCGYIHWQLQILKHDLKYVESRVFPMTRYD